MQKTSVFHKIRDILDAASQRSGDIAELSKRMHAHCESFVYYKAGPDGRVREYPCGIPSVRRQIRFCIDLGLIESEQSCALTDSGRNARRAGRFDLQLQQSVLQYLQDPKFGNVQWSKIEAGITRLPFPDARSLYEYSSPKIPEVIFRTCLFLLSVCGEQKQQNMLTPLQNKLYLNSAKLQQVIQILEEVKKR